MTDHPRTPDDDLLRDALRAESADVHADDALLARIRSATAPPPAWRRRTPLLAMAAALVVIAGLAAMLLRSDDDQVDVVDDTAVEGPDGGDGQGVTPEALTLCHIGEISPSGQVVAVFLAPNATEEEAQVLIAAGEQQRSAGAVASLTYLNQAEAHAVLEEPPGRGQPQAVAREDVSPYLVLAMSEGVDNLEVVGALSDLDGVIGTSQVDCSEVDGPATSDDQPVAAGGDRPTLVALVREDGWLVTVDLETGEQRELYTHGDPTVIEPGLEEGGPSYIDGVELSPDGQWIWFSTCCEPASGNTYRIPVTGGEPELEAVGAFPRISPDGRWVATGGSDMLIVAPTQPGAAEPASLQLDCCIRSLAWSPDGTELAIVEGTGAEGETPQVRRFTWDGATLAEASMGKPDNPGWFVLWTPEGMLTTVEGEPIANDRGRSQDASYRWILWVDEEGVIKEQAGFEAGDITPISGLPEALAADW